MVYLLFLRRVISNPYVLGLILFGLLAFGNYYQYNKNKDLKRELAEKRKENVALVEQNAHSMDVIQQNDKDCQDLLEKTKTRTITVVKHKKQLIESKNVDLDYIIPDDYITTMNETLSK